MSKRYIRLIKQVKYYGQNHNISSGKLPAGPRNGKPVFQLTYAYEARKPVVKEKIVEMAHNDSGVRDSARILKIGINTVIRTLKNSRHNG